MKTVTLSEHGSDRASERLGLNEAATNKVAQRALERGRRAKDFAGKFRKYLDKLHMSHPGKKDIVIYGDTIFIFRSETVLVTTYKIPSEFRKYL